jgi:hypothetical protein
MQDRVPYAERYPAPFSSVFRPLAGCPEGIGLRCRPARCVPSPLVPDPGGRRPANSDVVVAPLTPEHEQSAGVELRTLVE